MSRAKLRLRDKKTISQHSITISPSLRLSVKSPPLRPRLPFAKISHKKGIALMARSASSPMGPNSCESTWNTIDPTKQRHVMPSRKKGSAAMGNAATSFTSRWTLLLPPNAGAWCSQITDRLSILPSLGNNLDFWPCSSSDSENFIDIYIHLSSNSLYISVFLIVLKNKLVIVEICVERYSLISAIVTFLMGNDNNCQAFCESLVADIPRERFRNNERMPVKAIYKR